MTRRELIEKVKKKGACNAALQWIHETPGTLKELWNKASFYHMDWLCRQLGLADAYSSQVLKDGNCFLARRKRVDDVYNNQMRSLDEWYEERVAAEYNQDRDTPRAEYWAKIDHINVTYRAKGKKIYDADRAKCIPIELEYKAQLARTLRAKVSWAQVEKALKRLTPIPT